MLIPEMGSKPMDPATENYTMMYQKPVKAYGWQDHDSHIAVHEAFMSDPAVIPQDPRMQQALAGTLQAHIQEHQAHKYRMAIMANAGIELPNAPEYDRFNPGKDNWKKNAINKYPEILKLYKFLADESKIIQKEIHNFFNSYLDNKRDEINRSDYHIN